MADLYFEGRELKPYGEYVLNDQLVIGRVYFKVGFLDEDMVVPEMYALVFIGRDLHPKLPGLYFQDVDSYFGGLRRDPEEFVDADDVGHDEPDGRQWITDDYEFEWQRHRKFSGVYEFDGALNTLLASSLRRKTWDGKVRRSAHSDDGSGS